MLSLEFTRVQKIQVDSGVRTIKEGTARVLIELGTEFCYGKDHVVGVWSDTLNANHITMIRRYMDTLENGETQQRVEWFQQHTGVPIIKIAVNNIENLHEGEDINKVISRAIIVRKAVELK
jgi:hypothetical protein